MDTEALPKLATNPHADIYADAQSTKAVIL